MRPDVGFAPETTKRRTLRQVSLVPNSGVRAHFVRRIRAGRSRSPPPLPASLLLGTLNSDDAEAGVLTANVGHIPLLFLFECLDRVHITEL